MKAIIANKYQIIEMLKDQADCQVCLCINLYLKSKWVIKYVPGKYKKPPLELEILLNLQIRGVPRVVDVIYDGSGCYYVMEYIRGMTLHEAMENKRVNPRTYIKWMLHMASILESIHSLNVVHGDIKPSNIMILEDDSVVLIDFGSSFESLDSRSYTLEYVAPERLLDHCEVNEKSDLYSMGLVYKEMMKAFKYKGKKLNKLVKGLTRVNPENRIPGAYVISDILNSYS